jgi:cell wall-associated NlpC family hydrolase
VGFANATLNNDPRIAANAQNQPLNNVPTAFLRTLVHEAGHAFNLFHPKHDTHKPPIGREIMNQTGDVISFADATNTYPGNASFFFAEHDRTSLIHSPDPQVRPGWKNFGWGHGDLSAGLPAPVDVSGLVEGDGDDGLELTIRMANQAFVGEYLTAEVTLANTGAAPREVTSKLTLAEGDLVFLRTAPSGDIDHVLDITVGCGPRPMVVLQPGQSISNHVQVFFTNQGVTFSTPGRHTVVAQLEVDAVTTVMSAPMIVDVRMASSEGELDISAKTLTKGVGKALALGDFASDEGARGLLTELAESYADTDTGAASALVMANSLARSFTDYRADRTRAAAPREAQRFLDLAIEGRSAARAVELAVTVASPTEKDAPVVANTLTRLRRGRKPRARSAAANDLAAAERIAEDFAEPQAR